MSTRSSHFSALSVSRILNYTTIKLPSSSRLKMVISLQVTQTFVSRRFAGWCNVVHSVTEFMCRSASQFYCSVIKPFVDHSCKPLAYVKASLIARKEDEKVSSISAFGINKISILKVNNAICSRLYVAFIQLRFKECGLSKNEHVIQIHF